MGQMLRYLITIGTDQLGANNRFDQTEGRQQKYRPVSENYDCDQQNQL